MICEPSVKAVWVQGTIDRMWLVKLPDETGHH